MCIIILSSRIYARRHPNDEIFVLLLTYMGHFLILELGDYDYRGITANNWHHPRGITVSFVPITAEAVPITVQLTILHILFWALLLTLLTCYLITLRSKCYLIFLTEWGQVENFLIAPHTLCAELIMDFCLWRWVFYFIPRKLVIVWNVYLSCISWQHSVCVLRLFGYFICSIFMWCTKIRSNHVTPLLIPCMCSSCRYYVLFSTVIIAAVYYSFTV